MLSKHTCYSILNYGSAFLRSDLVLPLLLVFVMGIADGENVSPWRTRALDVSFSGFFIQKGFEMLTRLYVKMHPGVCWCAVFLFTICMSLNSELIGGLAPASPVEGPFYIYFYRGSCLQWIPQCLHNQKEQWPLIVASLPNDPLRKVGSASLCPHCGLSIPLLTAFQISAFGIYIYIYIYLIRLRKKGALHFLFLLSDHSSCCRL